MIRLNNGMREVFAVLARITSLSGFLFRYLEDRVRSKVPLSAIHVANCRVLLNRDALLAQVAAGGIVAELGVDQGGFSHRILNSVQPRQLVLIDTWASRRFGKKKFDAVQARFAAQTLTRQVMILRCDSLVAVGQFDDAYFDFVYIDTDHSYANTLAELRTWAPKLSANGMLAGHDYTMGNWVRGVRYGVVEAIHEFCVSDGWELAFLTAEPVEGRSFAIRRIAG